MTSKTTKAALPWKQAALVRRSHTLLASPEPRRVLLGTVPPTRLSYWAPPTTADSGEEAVDSALLGAIRAWRQARDARCASKQRAAAAAAAPRARRQQMRTNAAEFEI